MSIDKIDLQIAYGAVKHFGRNLYTSNPPAIAEPNCKFMGCLLYEM